MTRLRNSRRFRRSGHCLISRFDLDQAIQWSPLPREQLRLASALPALAQAPMHCSNASWLWYTLHLFDIVYQRFGALLTFAFFPSVTCFDVSGFYIVLSFDLRIGF